jgi:hypothetical protein
LAKKSRVWDGTAWQELASAQTDLTAYSTTAEISSTYATKADFPEGAWQTWAPTLGGGWANGNGVWTALYAQIGKTVFITGKFTIGSTTTIGTDLNVSLPVNTSGSGVVYLGTSRLVGNMGMCVVAISAPTITTLRAITVSGSNIEQTTITSTIPVTWTAGMAIEFSLTYQGV